MSALSGEVGEVERIPFSKRKPTLRRQSSKKDSRRRDMSAVDMNTARPYAPPPTYAKQISSDDESPVPVSRRSFEPSGVSLAAHVEQEPEEVFWDQAIDDGARHTDSFFDGTLPPIESPNCAEVKETLKPKGILSGLGYFCVCSPDDDDDGARRRR